MKTIEQTRDVRKSVVLAVCCMSILIVGLDSTVLNIALPSIKRDFHASIAGAQWTIDAYTLVLGTLLLTGGALGDRVGRRRVFQIGLCLFTVGSILCSLAPSLGALIVFRMLQAFGGSMMNPIALSIISNTFTSSAERARAFGIWAGVIGLSTALGPIVGGALVSSAGWRSVFWLNVPIGVAAITLTRQFIPESRSERSRRPDPLGQLLIAGFLALLIYAIIEAPAHGWSAGSTIACFSVSALCLVLLIPFELRHSEPVIELRFFRSVPFAAGNVIALGSLASISGFLFLNTLFLQDVRGLSVLRAGLFFLPLALAMAIAGPVSGRFVATRGPRIPLMLGGFFYVLADLLFIEWGSNLPDARLFVGFVCTGLGFGLSSAAITNIAISGMPRSQSGVAGAAASTMRQIGTSFGVAMVGSLLATTVHNVEASTFVRGARAGYVFMLICAATIVVAAAAATGPRGLATTKRVALLFNEESP